MNISVIGSGYVGLVTGACLAGQGHSVVCVDINEDKVQSLRQGVVPFFEEGLPELVAQGLSEGTLRFTSNVAEAVAHPDVVFIAVGTPPSADGSADTRAVFAAIESIGKALEQPTTIVIRSTVPVGTAEAAREMLSHISSWHAMVVSNPEFLREGHSVSDFYNPARVVLGARESDVAAVRVLQELYGGFVPEERIVVTSPQTAEFAKYACNAFLAAKISFVNELSMISGELAVDMHGVQRVMGMDPRIGNQYLSTGIGYGGSCLPKDVLALRHMASTVGIEAQMLTAVQGVNDAQPGRAIAKLKARLGSLRGRSIAVWGLAFKPNTDDVRSAPAFALIERLLAAGATVKAYDPMAMPNSFAHLGRTVEYATDVYDCVEQADALVLTTEWPEFGMADWRRVRTLMRQPLVVDGRGVLDAAQLAHLGFTYQGLDSSREPQHASGNGASAVAGGVWPWN